LLLSLMIGNVFLKLYNLGHEDITFWDELLHALVAKNLAKHPLLPTLYDQPYLPYDYRNWWMGNYIWLHKSPLALWQIAFSYSILGVSAFALRLPSLIISTLTLPFTYLIGTELYNKKVGLLAVFLQVINPFLLLMVHGYMFSDHINITLILWVEVSCYFLIKGIKSGDMRYFILSGVAQGLGYLAKSYLCMIPFGIAVGLFLFSKIRFISVYKETLNLKKLLVQLGSSILTASPWVLFCFIKYRREFLFEEGFTFAHINTSIEGWQRSWDYHLFNYMPSIYPYLYIAIIVCAIMLIVFAIRERQGSDAFLALWILGVVVILSIAKSKVPAGTDIAIPALLLCMSCLFFRKTKNGSIHKLAFLSSITAISLSQYPLKLIIIKDPAIQKLLSPLKNFAPAFTANIVFFRQILFFIAIFAFLVLIYVVIKFIIRSGTRIYNIVIKIMIVPILILLVIPIMKENLSILRRPIDKSFEPFADVGSFADANLPKNSVFFLETADQSQKYRLMFYSDRSVYAVLDTPVFNFVEGAWSPKGLQMKNLDGFSVEGDFLVDKEGKFLGFDVSGEYYNNTLHFIVKRSNAGVVGIYRRKEDMQAPLGNVPVVQEASFQTLLNMWYKTRITSNDFSIKQITDTNAIDIQKNAPLIQFNITDLLKARNYNINVVGCGYIDNIRIFRDGEQIFFDDFENETVGAMPSKWEFYEGTMGDAVVTKDPKNPLNKVLYLNSPVLDPTWLAKVVKNEGGIPYLVSTKDYNYPLIYKSSVSPNYRIYALMVD
jgi:4-amino-4-deoxy-L-arabinose transferase-like glycosyltransferase